MTILFVAHSKSGNRIQLSRRTWQEKICREHPEFGQKDIFLEAVKSTIEDPDYIVKGWTNELLALKWCKIAPRAPKHLCVVYREGANNDGFVITSFFITRYDKLLKREVIWRKD